MLIDEGYSKEEINRQLENLVDEEIRERERKENNEKERQDKERERQHQIAVLQLQNNSNESSNQRLSENFLKTVPQPKSFDPSNGERLDHFFKRYEIYADYVKMDDKLKAVGIANLLPPEITIILEGLSHQERTFFT